MTSLMQYLLPPLVAVLVIFIAECIQKKKHSLYRLLVVFTVVLGGMLYLTPDKAEAYELTENTYVIDEEYMALEKDLSSFFHMQTFYNKYICLNFRQALDLQQKADYHMKEGQRCFIEANRICLLIPNHNDREMVKTLFASAMATCIGAQAGPFSAIVSGLTVLLGDYSSRIYDQWCQMNTLLLASQYHFEQHEFYMGILEKEGY